MSPAMTRGYPMRPRSMTHRGRQSHNDFHLSDIHHADLQGSSSSRPDATTMIAVASVTAVAAYWIHSQYIAQYGWEGTLRYIWEGQPFSDEIQDALHRLDKATVRLAKQESLLTSMEETLDRARLDCVDNYRYSKKPGSDRIADAAETATVATAATSITSFSAEQQQKGAVSDDPSALGHDDSDIHDDPVSSDRKCSNEHVGILWVAYFADNGNLEKQLGGLSSSLDKIAASVDSVILGSSTSPMIQRLKARKKALSKQVVMAMERTDAMMASFQILVQSQ